MIQKSLAIAAFLSLSAFSNSAFAEGDAAAGEKVFKKCAACHTIGEGAKNRVGPVLTGVVGRKTASFEGYKYSKSMTALGETGMVWDEESIAEFLTNPKKYLRAKLDDKKAKTKMSFRLKKEDDRANIIAYLKTFSKSE